MRSGLDAVKLVPGKADVRRMTSAGFLADCRACLSSLDFTASQSGCIFESMGFRDESRDHFSDRQISPRIACKKLHVNFSTGEVRIYECRPLLSQHPFRALEDERLFMRVHADPHGYAVIWNDDIDLAESELWLHGTPAEPDAAPQAGPAEPLGESVLVAAIANELVPSDSMRTALDAVS